MARGLNKIMLIGNLGKDPEMKYTQQGTPVTSFSMAVSRSWKTADGQAREETEWFRITAWRKLAETCNEYLRKGNRVYIEGRLSTHEYQGTDGTNRMSLEVEASEMLILENKPPGAQGGGYSDERPAPSHAASGGGGRGAAAADDGDMDLDDLPF